jgi:hypothetical protein
MSKHCPSRSFAIAIASGLSAVSVGYALLAAISWYRFGWPTKPLAVERDALVDRFMPVYQIVDRHHVRVAAPAAVTFAAAREQQLMETPLVRAIFKMRQFAMRARSDEGEHPRGLVDATRALGWGVLAELPDREIVMGAVTRPWEPNVTFRALPPDDFAAFSEPGFVKIVWTLRADPIDATTSTFRTETRAVATDELARLRFRRYWALVAPGIALIRRCSLQPLRRAAEQRVDEAAATA